MASSALPARSTQAGSLQVGLWAGLWQRAATLPALFSWHTSKCPAGTIRQPQGWETCCQLRNIALLSAFVVQVVSANPPEERKKKAPGEVIRYSRDFLMKFVQVRCWPASKGAFIGMCTSCKFPQPTNLQALLHS
jgi:hypothetical protein